MSKLILFTGSYSAKSGEGIYTLEFDSALGRLKPLFDPVYAENPSYLRVSGDRRHLYAALETRNFQSTAGGGVSTYEIGENGELRFQKSIPTFGFDPCYIGLNKEGTLLAAANYSSGSLSVFSVDPQGIPGDCPTVKSHEGSGPNPERQEMPHVHFTDFTPDGAYLCTVDLGTDTVWFYRCGENPLCLAENPARRIALRPGSGPRHVLFDHGGRILYLITELSSEIAVFELDGAQYRPVQSVPTLPPDFSGANTAAALRLSPDGRFCYASNRGHDSIACFRINTDGTLAPNGIYPAAGRGPRDFAIEPQGNWLLAANERSHEISVLKRDAMTGALTPAGTGINLHSPTCLAFAAV